MKTLFAAALVAATVAGFGAADAMTLAPATTFNQLSTHADVIQVRGGCGRGFHRGPYGGCRVNRGRYWGPPRVVRPMRRCPPGFFWRHGRCWR